MIAVDCFVRLDCDLEYVGVLGLEVDFSNLLRREGVMRGRSKQHVVSHTEGASRRRDLTATADHHDPVGSWHLETFHIFGWEPSPGIKRGSQPTKYPTLLKTGELHDEVASLENQVFMGKR